MENKQPDMASDDYFGLCPICHKTDGHANAGRSHEFFCKKHKTRWSAGSNLLDDWRYQTLEEQLRIWDEIGLEDFQEVEPYFHPRQHSHQALDEVVGHYENEDPFTF